MTLMLLIRRQRLRQDLSCCNQQIPLILTLERSHNAMTSPGEASLPLHQYFATYIPLISTLEPSDYLGCILQERLLIVCHLVLH